MRYTFILYCNNIFIGNGIYEIGIMNCIFISKEAHAASFLTNVIFSSYSVSNKSYFDMEYYLHRMLDKVLRPRNEQLPLHSLLSTKSLSVTVGLSIIWWISWKLVLFWDRMKIINSRLESEKKVTHLTLLSHWFVKWLQITIEQINHSNHLYNS